MEIEVHLKRLGKKKIHKQSFRISNTIESLRDLICAFVSHSVAAFNANLDNNNTLSFLTPSDIQSQSESGKIGFNVSENQTTADVTESINTALQAFEDGMFLVFIDDTEIKALDEHVQLTETSTLVFIRMTFLAGTYW